MVGHITFLFPTFIRTYSDPLKTVGLITVGHNPEVAIRTYYATPFCILWLNKSSNTA
jgi:hypothetical protein